MADDKAVHEAGEEVSGRCFGLVGRGQVDEEVVVGDGPVVWMRQSNANGRCCRQALW